MILFIDASDPEVCLLALVSPKIKSTLRLRGSASLSEMLLPNLQKLLKKQKVSLSEIKKIIIKLGPGPFSRLRTSVALANALAFSLGVKILGIKGISPKLEQLTALTGGTNLVRPYYSKPANITKPRTLSKMRGSHKKQF